MDAPTTQDVSLFTRLRSYLVLGFLGLVWGSSFILIKKGLEVYDPLQVAALRLTISALSFLPILTLQLRRVDWSRWPYLLAVGLFGSGIPAFMFAFAQTEISSSVTGILNSLTPLFTLVLGILLFRAELIWMKVTGVLVGLAGAVLLIILGQGIAIEGNVWFSLFAIVGTICYGLNANIVGAFLRDVPALAISAASFVMVGLPALFYLVTTDFFAVLTREPGAGLALAYIATLAVVGTVVASIVFFQLIKWTNAVFSSTVAYLIPLVALTWGFIDGEPMTAYHFVGMGLILGGVYLSRQ